MYLPDELLISIFLFFDRKELQQYRLVCRSFDHVIDSELMYRLLISEDSNERLRFFKAVFKPKQSSFDLTWNDVCKCVCLTLLLGIMFLLITYIEQRKPFCPICKRCTKDCPSVFPLYDCYGLPNWHHNVCNGYGICIDKDICECNKGWFGKDCSYTQPPKNCFGNSVL